MTCREALRDANGISSEVNATLFYGWLNRNGHIDEKELREGEDLIQLARDFIEEYKQ